MLFTLLHQFCTAHVAVNGVCATPESVRLKCSILKCSIRRKWIAFTIGLMVPIVGCAPKTDSNPSTGNAKAASLGMAESVPNSSESKEATQPLASTTELAVERLSQDSPRSMVPAGQLDFTQLTLPVEADANGIIQFLGTLDKTMQDLLRMAGTPKLTQDEAARQARVLSDMKLEAANRLEAKASVRLHKELALLAKLEALSHAAGLGDSKSAAVLRKLASNTSSIESKLVAHQAAIVLLGFQLSDLAAGLSDAATVMNQLDLILDDRSSLKLPDFHVCAQTLKVLQQHGMDEPFELAKKKTVAAFSDHSEPPIAMKLWYLKFGDTPEFSELNNAMKESEVPIADFQKALLGVEKWSASQWSIGYLMQNFTNLEFSGQLEKVGIISDFIDSHVDWISIPDLKSDAEKLISGFRKRISVIGNPFPMQDLVLVPSGETFDPATLTGKTVLVDFWASWCGPCRAEFPNLRNLYAKYHERGFEIVGVNLDERPGDMLSLLKMEPLPWLHVRAADQSLSGFKNPLAIELGLTGIPFLMLIGPDGKTIAIHTRGLSLSNQLAQLFPE